MKKDNGWLEQSSEKSTVSTVPFFWATRYKVHVHVPTSLSRWVSFNKAVCIIRLQYVYLNNHLFSLFIKSKAEFSFIFFYKIAIVLGRGQVLCRALLSVCFVMSKETKDRTKNVAQTLPYYYCTELGLETFLGNIRYAQKN